MLLLWVATMWAQTAPSSGDLLQFLGPFAVYAVPSSLWLRDLSARLKEAQRREQLLNDRLLELAERSLPAMTENTRVLSEVADELKRMNFRRDR